VVFLPLAFSFCAPCRFFFSGASAKKTTSGKTAYNIACRDTRLRRIMHPWPVL